MIASTVTAALMLLWATGPASAQPVDEITSSFVEWAAAEGYGELSQVWCINEDFSASPIQDALCYAVIGQPFDRGALVAERSSPMTGSEWQVVPASRLVAATDADTGTGEQASTSFGGGTYLVGVDIEPGVYRAEVENVDFGLEGMPEMANCTWARLSGLTGEYDDEIANGFVMSAGPQVVEVLDSDRAFTSEGCGTWEKIG